MTLHLPYKPFTLAEVAQITGASQVDTWADLLGPSIGDDLTTIGLSYMQTFGIFVGTRWLEEGAPAPRATSVAKYVAGLDFTAMEQELARGHTFPCPKSMMDRPLLDRMRPWTAGILVKPPNSRLGKTLNLSALHREFRQRLATVFPNDPKLTS
jgi:hypothetical protein